MPVSTDTFRNQNTLHTIFAISAVILLGSTLWLIAADYNRAWRQHQRDARLWETAMTLDAADHALTAEDHHKLQQLEEKIDQFTATLPHEEIKETQRLLQAAQQDKGRLALPAAAIKGEIGPKVQQLERAKLAKSNNIEQIAHDLDQLTELYNAKEKELVHLDLSIASHKQKLRDLRAVETEINAQISSLTRARDAAREKLLKVNPTGLAGLSHIIRNAPLLDWFNPTEKVQQLVLPEIRTDLNFLTIESIDRCNTCHVNIDKPAYEEKTLLLFAERQVASYEGQRIDTIDQPVVLRDFWETAAQMAGLEAGLKNLQAQTRDTINQIRTDAGMQPLDPTRPLGPELDRIALHERGRKGTPRPQWYTPLTHYQISLKKLLRVALGDQPFRRLMGLYRHELIERYNTYRQDTNLPRLNANTVMLAHPKLDLYVEPESSHPAKTMGCTSCHEGSGQETDFVHAVHTPQDIWVDAQTGTAVPEFLLIHSTSDAHEAPHPTHDSPPEHTGLSLSLDGATAAMASSVDATHTPPQHAPARFTHDDVKLTDPHNPAPFAPVRESHAQTMAYHSPIDAGQTRQAIRQAEYWQHQYNWHSVHYMEWEKPMHRLEFVESSCNKCHTEIFDIQNEAPKLFEGRLLFAQLGCANCHAVDSLKDDLDIKKVGPSLVNLKHKLSKPMTASWIWAPKAFRPTSKMPHYFMLENNSSPVDIQRTRTEVAAITHYLFASPPAAQTPPYEPELPPEDLEGNSKTGKQLFNSLGCLACHTNLEEQGRDWIVEDLVARQHLDEEQADEAYNAMSYNQRRWYAMEHLPDKLTRTGPDLSGEGTKLTAGRDPATAQQEATVWLYNWLRHPRHYSSYTIMPSLRLSEQEAVDLAAYLLTLRRPGYQPEDFLAFSQTDQKMLAELVANLKAAGQTIDMAREEAAQMSTPEQLSFLGRKIISHYGCSSCHLINGFETAASTCANLDDWGLKDPHKLDFGYFDHAFDTDRQQPISNWKVDHEGVGADAPQIKHTNPKVKTVSLIWEQMDNLDRRPWLYHKLHNPRVYDRGRTTFEGYLGGNAGFDPEDSSIGRPYDKLKMPKFFVTDQQVRALITFVTSIRKPLVAPTMRQSTMTDTRMRLARGRQIATRYNCYGCHMIEYNSPQIWDPLQVFNPDGGFNYESLNNAPPRLLGQGAKTQPQWLHQFLYNVEELRPWLKIRMPSFPFSDDHAAVLVDYFAAASHDIATRLAKDVQIIDARIETITKQYLENMDGLSKADAQEKLDRLSPLERIAYLEGHNKPYFWFKDTALNKTVNRVKRFLLNADLIRPRDIDPRYAPLSERSPKWAKALNEMRIMNGVNDVTYPFTPSSPPISDAQWFARGEKIFRELRCYQCHALGDEETLFKLWELDNPIVEEDEEALAADEEGDEGDYGYDDEDDEGYGDDDEGYGDEEEEAPPPGPVYSAPNLSLTANRLQRQWVDFWLQEPATMQPGTKMPQWFPSGNSAFVNYPGQAKGQMHSMFGYAGADQRRLLLDFVYEAGRRGYTPGAQRLSGAEPVAIDLPPLPPPKIDDPAPAADDSPTPNDDAGTATEEKPAPAPVAPPAEPQPEPQASTIELHEDPMAPLSASGKGRIVGVVRFDGKPPRRKPIRMGADAYCNKAHKKKVFNESVVVNPDGSMKNVFVYVKSGLSGSFPPPQDPATINQVGCMYRPHVLGVMAGQPLLIRNDDNTLHNVKMNSSNNGSFNEGMPVKGMVLTKTLTKPEQGIAFKCDVHPWMGAYLYVMKHPFFSVSDIEGRFEIKGLPPGTYLLEAVHESKKIPPVTFELTVEADTSHRIDVTLTK